MLSLQVTVFQVSLVVDHLDWKIDSYERAAVSDPVRGVDVSKIDVHFVGATESTRNCCEPDASVVCHQEVVGIAHG